MYYVYLLQSKKDDMLYTGYTNDLRRRLKEHNDKENFSTKSRAPFQVIYYEAYLEKEDAQSREKFLKTGWGRQYIQRVLKHHFQKQHRGLSA